MQTALTMADGDTTFGGARSGDAVLDKDKTLRKTMDMTTRNAAAAVAESQLLWTRFKFHEGKKALGEEKEEATLEELRRRDTARWSLVKLFQKTMMANCCYYIQFFVDESLLLKLQLVWAEHRKRRRARVLEVKDKDWDDYEKLIVDLDLYPCLAPVSVNHPWRRR